MSFYWILFVTVLFYLELTEGEDFGYVYVVKHPDSNELTCISDDNDAAFVWNYDFDTSMPSGLFKNFEPVKPIENIFSTNLCAIWRLRQCRSEWYASNDWEKTSALENPMAPVVDYRWEGFKEYVVDDDIPQQVIRSNSNDGTVVFSFRGAHNIRIYLCRDILFSTSECILIKLSIDGKYSAIETCQHGDMQCYEVMRSPDHNYPILDAYEWRTFRLQWISNEKTVKVFRDINENAFLEAKFKESHFIDSIWISSSAATGIRLHNYNYILAKKANTKIISEEFRLREESFCVNMLVSLCPECHLIVSLIDSNTGETLIYQNIYGNVNFYANGLRTWQSIKVILPLKNLSLHKLKLQLKTDLRNDYLKDVWWAVDDIRVCERNDGLRMSTIPVPFWNMKDIGSDIKCQKLLRNRIVVADSSNRLPSNDISWLSAYIRRVIEGRSSRGRTSNTANCDHTSSTCRPENKAIAETEATSQPENLQTISESLGIVKLKWSYPLFTPRKMVRFHIEAHGLNTNIAINSCTESSTIDDVIATTDEQSFSMKLGVQTSTEYRLHLETVDYCNRTTMIARRSVSISEGFPLFIKNQRLSNFKETIVELEVPPVASATKNTKVVVAVNGVWSCESNRLEDLSFLNDWTKPLMKRVIAEFPIRSREPVNSTFDTNEQYKVEKICQFQHPKHYWLLITLMDSPFKNVTDFDSTEVDEKLGSNVWLVMIPVLVISLLLLILFIWYWRHRKIPEQRSHSPDVPFEPPYLVPRNWMMQTSRVKNNSSNSPCATISDNSREQSSDAQDASFPPLYIEILDDSEEQANHARNISVTPLYVNTPDNSREQTSFSQHVPSNSKVQTSGAESVPSSPLYTYITYDLEKQTSHEQNIPVAPLYVNTLNDWTEQSNHAQDDSYEPMYLKIIEN